MGAHSFVERSEEPDVEVAYRRLVEGALCENGHSPYNGTISTTSGYRVATTRPMGTFAARAMIEARIGGLSKWSTCEVLPVGRAETTEERSVWCDVDCTYAEHDRIGVTADLVARCLGVTADRIEHFEVVESKPRYSTKTTPAGPARTVWTTTAGGAFATRAEAVGEAKRQLAKTHTHPDRTTSTLDAVRRIEVHKHTVHEPPAAVVKTLTSWRVKVRASVAPDGERVFDHWLFYGMAAS